MVRKPRRAWLAAALLACGPGGREEVSFLASDAVQVGGRLVGSGRAAVLVLPAGDPASWHGLADRLAEDGYRVLVLQFRPSDDPRLLARDVLGAIEFLEAPRLAVVAEAERGGLALGMAGDRPVAGVAILSPVAPELRLAELARGVSAPKWLGSAIGDHQAVEAQRVVEANSPPPVESNLYPGSARGAELLAGSEVTDDILSFLGDVLENR